MKKRELIILLVIASLIAAVAGPKLVEERKVRHAIHDVQVIAGAIQRYQRKFGEYPRQIKELTEKKQSDDWNIPFLRAIPKHPWGGEYQIDWGRMKVGIAEDDESVPEKYRFGGIAEISEVIEEGVKLW